MAKLVKPDKHGISAAAEHIQNNGVVIFPTETVFGIGASAFIVRKVFKVFIELKIDLQITLLLCM